MRPTFFVLPVQYISRRRGCQGKSFENFCFFSFFPHNRAQSGQTTLCTQTAPPNGAGKEARSMQEKNDRKTSQKESSEKKNDTTSKK